MSLKSKSDNDLMILFDNNDPTNEKNAEILRELNSRGIYHKIRQPLDNSMKGIVVSDGEIRAWADKNYPNRKGFKLKTTQETLMKEFSKLTPDYTLQLVPSDYIENPTKHDGFKIIATHNKTKNVITKGHSHGGFSPIKKGFSWQPYVIVISMITHLFYPVPSDFATKHEDLFQKLFAKVKELNGYVEKKECATCGTDE